MLPIPAQDLICSSEHSTHRTDGPPLLWGMPTGPGQCGVPTACVWEETPSQHIQQWFSMGVTLLPGAFGEVRDIPECYDQGVGGEVGGYKGGIKCIESRMPLTA